MSDKAEGDRGGENKVIKFSEAGTKSLNLVANPSGGQNPLQASPAPSDGSQSASSGDSGSSDSSTSEG